MRSRLLSAVLVVLSLVATLLAMSPVSASAMTPASRAVDTGGSGPRADAGVSAAERKVFAAAASSVAAAAPEPPDVVGARRISEAADGTKANGPSQGVVAGDGEEVFMTSAGSNLVAGDTNGANDVFAKSLSTGAVTRLSVTSTGVQANGASAFVAATTDGSKVLFRSTATNLVSGDTNGLEDYFLLTRSTGAIARINLNGTRQITKAAENWQLGSVDLSPNGAYVVYTLSGTKGWFAHLKNLSTGVVKVLDAAPGGAKFTGSNSYSNGNYPTEQTRTAGTFHLFSGDSQYLFIGGSLPIPDGTSGTRVYRWNIAASTSELVSTVPVPAWDDFAGNSRYVYYLSSSSDGRFVTYLCAQCEFVPGMPWDVCTVGGPWPGGVASCAGAAYVKDMVTGQVVRLPREILGPPEPLAPQYGNEIRDAQISPDGRLVLVATRDFHDKTTWAVYEPATGAGAVLFGTDPQVFGASWNADSTGFSFNSAPGSLNPDQAASQSDTYYMGAMAAPATGFGGDDYGGTIGNYTRTDKDANVPGYGPELNVVRTYNSLDKRAAGAFGTGWSWNYDMRLTIAGNGDAYVSYPDGRVERHTKSGTTFTAPKSYASKLVTAGTGYELTQRDATVYRFGSAGRLLSISNANGHTLTLTYNGSGNLSRVTSASGRYLDVTWSGDRISTISTNPVGGSPLVWKYYYGSANRLQDACDPRNNAQNGHCLHYSYSGGFKNDLLTQVNNPDNSTLETISYRASDEKMSSRGDGSGATWSYTYPDPRISIETDPRNNTIKTNYDQDYRVIKVVDAKGFVSYGYDSNGYRDRVTDANGNVVTTGYNARGDVTQTTDGANKTAYFTYNAAGLVTESRSRRSSSASDNRYLTTYDYDAAGNKIRQTNPPTTENPSGATRRWVYTNGTEPAVGGGTTPAGLLKTEIDARNHSVTYAYDSKGDLRTMVDRAGMQTSYSYDNLGRRLSSTVQVPEFPAGLQTTFQYDALGSITQTMGPVVRDEVTGASHQLKVVKNYNGNHQLTSEVRSDNVGSDPSRTTQFGYDAAGRLDKVIDAKDGEIRRVFDGNGNVRTVTDQSGQVYQMTYDERNRPIKTVALAVTNPVTGQSQDITLEERGYDAGGRLSTSLDPLGRTQLYDYDGADRLTQVTLRNYRERNGTTRDVLLQKYDYDADGNVVTDLAGDLKRRIEQTWTADGSLRTQVLEPNTLNRTTTFTYNANGSVVSEELSAGSRTETTTFTYDDADRRTKETVQTGSGSLTTNFAYDQRGNLVSVTDPRGSAGDPAYTTDYTYDEASNVVVERAPPTTVTAADGSTSSVRPTTKFGYGTYGNRTAVQDASGAVTTSTFDKLDRVTSVQYPAYARPDGVAQAGVSESMTYSPTGNLTSWTDRAGNQWDYTFDSLNRPVRTTMPSFHGSRPVETTRFDDASRPIETVDAVGVTRKATYDDRGRLRTSTVMLANGGSPRPLTTTFDYDDLGNQTLVIDPLGHDVKATYNGASEQRTTTDGVGKVTDYTYDLAGRLTQSKTVGSDGVSAPVTSYGYDAASNLTSVTSPEGRVTGYAYNAVSWLTQVTQTPVSGSPVTTSYGYDARGLQTSLTDGRGNATRMSYNSWGLLEGQVVPSTSTHPSLGDRTWTTSYDRAGRVATEAQPGGTTVTNQYDSLGHLTTQSGSGSLDAKTRTFDYDAVGQLTSFSAPGGTQSVGYEERGLPTTSSGPMGTSSFGYDDAGRLTSRTDSAGTSGFGWDDANRLSSVSDPVTSLGTTYAYNDAGQLSSTTTSPASQPAVNTRALTYDVRGRLKTDTVAASGGAVQSAFTYGYDNDDLLTSLSQNLPGNPTSGAQSFAYDGAGRLSSWTNAAGTVQAVGYDAAGNRTSVGSRSFTFNARDQLTSTPEGARTYNARGDLVSAAAASGTRSYTWNSLGELTGVDATAMTYDALGRLSTSGAKSFSYAGTSPDPSAVTGSALGRSPSGRLLSASSGGTAYQVVNNRHGDVSALLGVGGSIAGSTTYSPFGEVTGTAGMQQAFGFQGDYTDPTSGLVSMGARWYDPASAGFVSRDSYAGQLARPVSLNRYTYGNGDPLGFTDPTGFCGFSLSGAMDCLDDAKDAVVGAATTVYDAGVSTVTTTYNTVSAGISYGYNTVASAVTTGMSYASAGWDVAKAAAAAAWNAGTEAMKSVAATAYRGVVQGVAATFTAAKGVTTAVRKAGSYTASTLLAFAKAPVIAAKACLGSSTCRMIATGVAVVAVAIACTACLVPMAVGAGIGAGIGALTCDKGESRGECALQGALSGALAGAAPIGAAGMLGKSGITLGSKLAQFTAGGGVSGLVGESTNQFMSGELDPGRLVAATVGGAALGAGVFGAGRAGRGVLSSVRGPNKGPVIFKPPAKGATDDEIAQMREHVKISNQALRDGALSPTGRTSTKGQIRTDANLAIARERAANPSAYPKGTVVGHVPDATWVGRGAAYAWMPQSSLVNGSLGGQAPRYPVGFQPTKFWFQPDYEARQDLIERATLGGLGGLLVARP